MRPASPAPGAGHAAPDSGGAPSSPTCRICWDVADPATPGGRLLSPCACRGTAAHIHVSCLAAWVHSPAGRGAAGAGRHHAGLWGWAADAALPTRRKCELCGSRFRTPRGLPAEDRDLLARGPVDEDGRRPGERRRHPGGAEPGRGGGGRLPFALPDPRALPWGAWRASAAAHLAATARAAAVNPADAALAAWVSLLAGRAVEGGLARGARGAAAGARLGWGTALRTSVALDFAPDAALAVWVAPRLGGPLARAARCLLLTLTLQVAAPAAAGAYLGAVAGAAASLARDARAHAAGVAAVGRGVGGLVGLALFGRRGRRGRGGR